MFNTILVGNRKRGKNRNKLLLRQLQKVATWPQEHLAQSKTKQA